MILLLNKIRKISVKESLLDDSKVKSLSRNKFGQIGGARYTARENSGYLRKYGAVVFFWGSLLLHLQLPWFWEYFMAKVLYTVCEYFIFAKLEWNYRFFKHYQYFVKIVIVLIIFLNKTIKSLKYTHKLCHLNPKMTISHALWKGQARSRVQSAF